MTKQTTLLLKLIAALAFVSACTKSRQAELPDETKADVFAISEFGTTSDNSNYAIKAQAIEANADSLKSVKALDNSSAVTLSSENVVAPDRLKFMFSNLPLSGQTSRQFKITFTIDKDFVTSYKVAASANDLTALEKNISISLKEAQLISKAARASAIELKTLMASQKTASAERELIKAGKQAGSLLVPIFKYKVDSYGVLERTKNELKESTAVLSVKKTEFKDATHIQLASRSDSRLLIGMSADQVKQMDQLFVESKIDNQVMTAAELQSRLNIGMKFVEDDAKVLTRLDADVMHIYKITNTASLNENQLRLLKNNAGNQEIISCQDASVAKSVNSTDKDCVLVLKADLPIKYKSSNLTLIDLQGNTSNAMQFDDVPRSKSVGLVEILANTAAKQVDISGRLDPNSSVRLADLKGEFFYRRTFEDASNMFLGQTGTSGDMSIVQFELEDKRLVVRNQQSLIAYTGQGAKDREEIMSFPVKYIRMNSISATGATLTIPVAELTTKEKAEYAIIDWTQNSVPNASSPLSFYDGGACFQATSSQRVTGTDMRLEKEGILNFSLSGSYTMKPEMGCITIKDVNSAYWGGTYQFNFNLSERISFRKRQNLDSDKQIAMNISSMAQEAFNFGVFTLADKVTENGTFNNRDGSEKYMPLIHDFRNGRKIKYYIGGLNNPVATPPERRQLMIEATQQVMKEWNATLRYAFRGTSLERAGDYVDVEVDNGTGHLGDLDRNYIWYQELPAENGLLGVAQPAANPRSGTIEASNVIIYSGNSYNQAEVLLAMTKLSREYENKMAQVRQQAFEEAKKTQTAVSTKDMKDSKDAAAAANSTSATGANADGVKRVQAKSRKIIAEINKMVAALRLNDKNTTSTIEGLNMKPSTVNVSKVLTKELLKQGKGQVINYEVNEKTFTKKIAELALNKSLIKNPRAFELAVNNAFTAYAGLDDISKAALQKRAQMLTLAVRFDENNKNRPGCFKYLRNDIEDEALNLDQDPHKNLLLNYRNVIMSTLSHELGHAFGLMHNFKASTDKANFEFPEDKNQPTGRNYSSIMDYIADIDMHYAGPGPYDAHALRAAYTGLVDLPEVKEGNALVAKVKVYNNKFVAIEDVMKAFGQKSLVNFTKDSLNTKGVLKYYEQCSDQGLSKHSMCAQFDIGGSASEIVKNKIADYNRGYTLRNYSYDKILFGWPQKIDIINRNINLFQSIRGYLDEAVITAIYGGGRTDDENTVLVADLINAAKMGYQFFHEVIRTPDAKDTSVVDFENRFYAIPYQYVGAKEMDTDTVKCKKNDKDIIMCNDIKVVEARSLYDVSQARDKIDTIGIGFDKVFAMQFLLQSSAAKTTDDSRVSMISYLDFEQWFMGIKDPAQSITLNTILQIMSNNLQGGFFAPSKKMTENTLVNLSVPVEINKFLGDQTALASVIGLAESKWQGYDAFAEAFKVGRSYVGSAPQDRPNVVRLGQDRSKSDTRVFYATQNGVAANALIKQAARSEAFLSNKSKIYPLLAAIYVADNTYRKMAIDLTVKACDVNDKGDMKTPEVCLAAQNKTLADYVKENQDIAKAKADADVVAAKLVTYMRELNANEVIMSKDLDKDDSQFNFAAQVEQIRSMLIPEIGLIDQILKVLSSTPKANLQATIEEITTNLQKVAATNSKLNSLPLFQTTFSFIVEYTKGMKAQLMDSTEVVTGDSIANSIVEASKMKESQDKILSVIETLSTYTGYVDPDTVSTR